MERRIKDGTISQSQTHVRDGKRDKNIPTFGVWRSSYEDCMKFTLKETRETIHCCKDKILVHARTPKGTNEISDTAISSMLIAAKKNGWKTLSLTGDLDFRKRAAAEAIKQGFQIADTDLQGHVREIEKQLREEAHKAFQASETAKIAERKRLLVEPETNAHTGPKL